jgi:hypothetical protein
MLRSAFILVLALATMPWRPLLPTAAGAAAPTDQTPSQEEVGALVERLVANQHRNDDALAEYERHERQTRRKGGNERIVEDKTYRVVPTGTGALRLLVEENGQAVKPEFYQKELRELEKVLLNALHPAEARQQQAIRKWEKRTGERRELVDAVPRAFRFSWLGRETRNGRILARLQLDPNPDFKPASRNVQMLAHVGAVLWVDEKEGQVARIEAEVIRDIAVGGGLLGKVYKGGSFVMDQVEAAPGVWLPSRYILNLDGRKFFFPFSVREASEARNYRRIGPPEEALAAVRRELAAGPAQPARPKPSNSNSSQ